jgi:hypothetical protein
MRQLKAKRLRKLVYGDKAKRGIPELRRVYKDAKKAYKQHRLEV